MTRAVNYLLFCNHLIHRIVVMNLQLFIVCLVSMVMVANSDRTGCCLPKKVKVDFQIHIRTNYTSIHVEYIDIKGIAGM